MKKIIFLVGLFAVPAFGAMDVREVGTECVSSGVNVSTTTPTALPTTALSGRNRIDIINTNNTYDVALGSFSAMTYAAGYVVTNSSDAATSQYSVILPSGKTLYGLGEANTVTGTVNVRLMECK